MKTDKRISAELAEIRQKLDSIEEHLVWLIKPDQRFAVGRRVEFSRRARKRGFPLRKRATRGIVKAIDGFSVVVLLDGYRKPSSYHHAFFNPVSGPKLF
jgi:hypothetical protein